jgi:hypothetical protein
VNKDKKLKKNNVFFLLKIDPSIIYNEKIYNKISKNWYVLKIKYIIELLKKSNIKTEKKAKWLFILNSLKKKKSFKISNKNEI